MIHFIFNTNTMNSTRFNALSSHFQDKIYASFKGKLRLAILERDFNQFNLIQPNTKTLDIGAGQGQFAYILASHDHSMTLLESSISMLELAQNRFDEHNLSGTFIHDELQNIPNQLTEPYDLVMAHAVIEWLENPLDIIPILQHTTHAHSTISLLFYNINGLIYHNLVRGNYRYVKKNNFHGEHGGLTPISPVDPVALEHALNAQGFNVIHKSGIRTYYDYMTKENKQKITEDEHIEMEMQCSTLPQFLPNARYLHWLIKPSS